MKRRALVLAGIVGWAVAVVVACGGSSDSPLLAPDGGTGPEGSTPPPPPSEGGVPPLANYTPAPAGAGKTYCEGTDGALIGYLDRCCDANDKTTPNYTLGAALFAYVAQLCGNDLEGSIAKGRVLYDPSLLSACTSQIQSLLTAVACGQSTPASASLGDAIKTGPCTTAFVGDVGADQACAHRYECAPGLTCIGYAEPFNADGGTPLEGVCKPPPAQGETCGQGRLDGGGSVTVNFFFGSDTPECTPGTYCTPTTNGSCVPQKASGATCSSASSNSTECLAGLACYVGKCAPIGSQSDVSGACGVDRDCKAGLYCAKPSPSGAGTCQTKKDASATCANANSSECKGRCAVPDGGTTGTCVTFCGSG